MKTKVEFELVYHELARRLLLGQSVPEAAQAMRLSVERVQKLTHNTRLRAVLAELRDSQYRDTDRAMKDAGRNLRKEIQDAAETSFDVLQDLLVAAKATETGKIKIAQDFLNRAGLVEAETKAAIVVNINTTDAAVLAEALRVEKAGEKLLGTNKELVAPATKFEHPKDFARGKRDPVTPGTGTDPDGAE